MRHTRWVMCGLKKATNKSTHPYYSMSAVIVKGGRVLAVGVNRDGTGYLKFKKFYEFQGVHAEVDAVLQCDPAELKGAEMYVVGKRSRTSGLITSKPCKACQAYLEDMGLKAVYYHDSKGLIQRMGVENQYSLGSVESFPIPIKTVS